MSRKEDFKKGEDMGVYVTSFFISLIVGFILSVVFAIVDSLWWLLLWPVSWVLIGLGACIDLSVGNVDNDTPQQTKED